MHYVVNISKHSTSYLRAGLYNIIFLPEQNNAWFFSEINPPNNIGHEQNFNLFTLIVIVVMPYLRRRVGVNPYCRPASSAVAERVLECGFFDAVLIFRIV